MITTEIRPRGGGHRDDGPRRRDPAGRQWHQEGEGDEQASPEDSDQRVQVPDHWAWMSARGAETRLRDGFRRITRRTVCTSWWTKSQWIRREQAVEQQMRRRRCMILMVPSGQDIMFGHMRDETKDAMHRVFVDNQHRKGFDRQSREQWRPAAAIRRQDSINDHVKLEEIYVPELLHEPDGPECTSGNHPTWRKRLRPIWEVRGRTQVENASSGWSRTFLRIQESQRMTLSRRKKSTDADFNKLVCNSNDPYRTKRMCCEAWTTWSTQRLRCPMFTRMPPSRTRWRMPLQWCRDRFATVRQIRGSWGFPSSAHRDQGVSQIEYVDEMTPRRGSAVWDRRNTDLPSKPHSRGDKQFCTVLMKGRTTELIADGWLWLLVSTSTVPKSCVWKTREDAHNVVWTGVRPEDETNPLKLEWSQRLRRPTSWPSSAKGIPIRQVEFVGWSRSERSEAEETRGQLWHSGSQSEKVWHRIRTEELIVMTLSSWLNDETVELIQVTLPSPVLTRLDNNRWMVEARWVNLISMALSGKGRGRDQSQILQELPQVQFVQQGCWHASGSAASEANGV